MGYFGKYDTPAELLQDDSLSRDEKIELLESWRDDKEAYMRASDEGMPTTGRTYLLRTVERALLELQEDGTVNKCEPRTPSGAGGG